MNQSIRSLFTLLLVGSTLTGCSSLGLLPKIKGIPVASDRNPVVEMICLWEAAEGTGTDGMPTRGFAGQILFFTANDKEPVKMNGDVRIYVFDDQGDEEDAGKPLHQFDFDSKAFQTFLHDTNLGGAYQLFIPYTRKGGHHATCSLRVRITPPSGKSLYSKMASVILPGTNEKTKQLTIEQEEKPHQTIEQMSYDIKVHDLRKSGDGESLGSAKDREINRDAIRSRLSQLADDTTASTEKSKTANRQSTNQPAKPAADHPLFAN